jgi:hypothetical protein
VDGYALAPGGWRRHRRLRRPGLLLACRVASRARRGRGARRRGGVWLGRRCRCTCTSCRSRPRPSPFGAALFLWWWLERQPAELTLDWLVWGAAACLLVAADHSRRRS